MLIIFSVFTTNPQSEGKGELKAGAVGVISNEEPLVSQLLGIHELYEMDDRSMNFFPELAILVLSLPLVPQSLGQAPKGS